MKTFSNVDVSVQCEEFEGPREKRTQNYRKGRKQFKICDFTLSYLVKAACINLLLFFQDYKELFAEEETGKVKAERRSTEDDSSAYTGQPNLNIE